MADAWWQSGDEENNSSTESYLDRIRAAQSAWEGQPDTGYSYGDALNQEFSDKNKAPSPFRSDTQGQQDGATSYVDLARRLDAGTFKYDQTPEGIATEAGGQPLSIAEDAPTIDQIRFMSEHDPRQVAIMAGSAPAVKPDSYGFDAKRLPLQRAAGPLSNEETAALRSPTAGRPLPHWDNENWGPAPNNGKWAESQDWAFGPAGVRAGGNAKKVMDVYRQFAEAPTSETESRRMPAKKIDYTSPEWQRASSQYWAESAPETDLSKTIWKKLGR